MNDDMLFEDEDEAQADSGTHRLPPWQVMIVDDEHSVHQVTQLVMSGFHFDGRALQFIDCYSAAEARTELAQRRDIALILLDVVMEHEHAGLDLVRHIREDLQNANVRIVLRTGQPGQAPQEHVIRTYDINDYKEKTDLTHSKLLTVFYSSLRAYRDLMRLERARGGLRRSIDAITEVCDSHNLRVFCSSVLEQASVLLGLDGEGVCASRISAFAAAKSAGRLKVLAVTQAYCDLQADEEMAGLPPPVRAAFERSMAEQCSHHGEQYYACYYRTRDGNESFLYMAFSVPIGAPERELLEVFSANVAITYDKLLQREEVEATQDATIAILGEALERRSATAGAHVYRVGEIAAMLGAAAGLSPLEVQQLRQAAPLHDIGHIGIPDALLHTPGPLDAEQWQLMRQHTTIGHQMLIRSGQGVLQLAAAIAHEHHERWDGSGYPRGLRGEAIALAARITALADFVDAMVSPRCYRPAWSIGQALDHARAESGRQFDPALLELLLARTGQLHALYLSHPST